MPGVAAAVSAFEGFVEASARGRTPTVRAVCSRVPERGRVGVDVRSDVVGDLARGVASPTRMS